MSEPIRLPMFSNLSDQSDHGRMPIWNRSL